MRYTDPDGRVAAVDDGIVVIVLICAAYLSIRSADPRYQESCRQTSAKIYLNFQVAKQNIANVLSDVKSKIKEITLDDDGVTMYHYSDTPPSEFKGALRPDSYITPDIYTTGKEAREKLAIPRNVISGEEKNIKYRYSVKVKPGEYRPAENSIPGSYTVAPLDGKNGGGTEFKTTVPLVPYKCEIISE